MIYGLLPLGAAGLGAVLHEVVDWRRRRRAVEQAAGPGARNNAGERPGRRHVSGNPAAGSTVAPGHPTWDDEWVSDHGGGTA